MVAWRVQHIHFGGIGNVLKPFINWIIEYTNKTILNWILEYTRQKSILQRMRETPAKNVHRSGIGEGYNPGSMDGKQHHDTVDKEAYSLKP